MSSKDESPSGPQQPVTGQGSDPSRQVEEKPIGDSIRGPVLAGVTALLAVAVAVGLVVAGGTLMVTKMLGLGGGSDSGNSPDSARSLYLPEISETGEGSSGAVPEQSDTGSPSESGSASAEGQRIVLTADPVEASASTQITLNVRYPAGRDAILQVQRKGEAGWEDFPASPLNMGGRSEASTWIVSSLTGSFQYRVRDTDNGKTSKPVTITLR